jgi:endoglucanase
MRKESMEFLKQLLTTPSPSGFESNAQRIWCDYAREFADEVRTDSYGNAMAVLNPGGGPRIMLDAHMDEIGMVVKHIDEKGFVYFQRIGGVDPALVQGKRVSIHTAKGSIRGIIGATAIHLIDRDKDRKVPKMHEVFVDIGAKDAKEAGKLVAIGDPMTFVDDFEMLSDHVAVARGFDNRAGAWVIIEALRIASLGKPKCAVLACSSVQEELGLLGAKMNVHHASPDAALVVDVTHATDSPGIDVKQHGLVKLGEGPTVSLGRENHPVMSARMRSVARRKKIRHQVETFSITGGTDAYVIHTNAGGVPSVLVSVPTRYMHSTVEVVDLRDLANTAELLGAFLLDVKKGEKFAVKV